MSSVGTNGTLPEAATGSQREKGSRSIPGEPLQEAFEWADTQAISDDIADGYEALREAIGAYGGQKKLAIELGEEISYNAKINEGVNRKGDRHAQFDWLFPVLRHPTGGPILLRLLCRVAGHNMPERRRLATDAELLRAVVEALDDCNGLGKAALADAAKRIGVDPSAFRRGR